MLFFVFTSVNELDMVWFVRASLDNGIWSAQAPVCGTFTTELIDDQGETHFVSTKVFGMTNFDSVYVGAEEVS